MAHSHWSSPKQPKRSLAEREQDPILCPNCRFSSTSRSFVLVFSFHRLLARRLLSRIETFLTLRFHKFSHFLIFRERNFAMRGGGYGGGNGYSGGGGGYGGGGGRSYGDEGFHIILTYFLN